MNLSEFIRLLRTDPANTDPEFLRARDSGPEFTLAAEESDRFEQQLGRALGVRTPPGLVAELQQIGDSAPPRSSQFRFYAIAASLLLIIGGAGITWRVTQLRHQSVEQYLSYHYELDGRSLALLSDGPLAENVEEILAGFQMFMEPELRRMVTVVKICRTPNGDGVHMVLHTETGPVTIIFMPKTPVTDGEMIEFDGMQAQLVSLERGSAAIIAANREQVSGFYSLVQRSILPLDRGA